MMRIEDCRWVLYCSGQFRCNGAWNKAARKIRYSSSSSSAHKNLSQRMVGLTNIYQLYLSHSSVLDTGWYAVNLFQCSSQSGLSCNSISGEKTILNSKQSLFTLSNEHTIVLYYHHFRGKLHISEMKQKHVLHPFYSLSLKLVSQASTGSQDIHTINFTDPPHSFETTSVLSLKNIDQY